MPRITNDIVIARPPADVFAAVTDPALLPRWQSSVRHAEQLGAGPLQPGSRVREDRRYAGRQAQVTWQVTSLEPVSHAAIEVIEGPVIGHAWYHLRARDGATQLTVAVDLEPTSATARRLRRVVMPALAAELESDCSTLRRLLESDAVPAPAPATQRRSGAR